MIATSQSTRKALKYHFGCAAGLLCADVPGCDDSNARTTRDSSRVNCRNCRRLLNEARLKAVRS